MKRLLLAMVVIMAIQYNAYASWYGCAEYTNQKLESMSEQELKEAYEKNVKLSELIYEDAAVQSIFDKRLYHFRSQQYIDCIKYIEQMDLIIKRKFPEEMPSNDK